MKLPDPRGILHPPILPPLGDLAPLPKLTLYPERVVTPSIFAELGDRDTPAQRAIDALIEKVRAEDERMRRLLPAAPPGMYWEAELQTGEPSYAFERNAADMVVRLVYRLRAVESGA